MDMHPDTAHPDALATVEGMACIAVVPYGPEVGLHLGSRREWAAYVADTYGPLLAMSKVLQKDERQLADMARDAGQDAMMEMQRWMHETGRYLAAQAELLDSAAARVMIGMAQASVAERDL